MESFLVALAVVFVAELGDKTQLVVLTMGARQRPVLLLAGLAVVAAVLMGIAVTVGAAVGSAVPDRAITAFAGVLFLGFAVWTWHESRDEPDEVEPVEAPDSPEAQAGDRRGLFGVLGAFTVAELGDKTQLTAASLAAGRSAFGVWIGATLGLVAASAVALLAGRFLRNRISDQLLGRLGAGAFAIVGVLSLASAARG